MRFRIPFSVLRGSLFAALVAAVFASPAFALSAGQVDFSFGDVSAKGSDGNVRALGKGAAINDGDSIVTGNGRVQIRFTDGAYLSLQPNTTFVVEKFAFTGKQDGNEKAIFRLLRGGLRKITGLIGKVNKDSYTMHTPTATLGIRGTAYSANQIGDTLIVTVGEGRVSVTNDNGSLVLGAGQSAIVASPQAGPEMTTEKALAPAVNSGTRQLEAEENIAAVGEQRTTLGDPLPLTTTTTPPVTTAPPPPILVSGPGYAVAYSFFSDPTPSGSHIETNANATLDPGQTLTSFVSSNGSLDLTAGAAQITSSDGLIGWGRWIGPVSGSLPGTEAMYGSNEGLHYVVGIPTATAALPVAGTATYSLVGATPPVTFDGMSGTSLGTLNGAVDVLFTGAASLQMTLNLNIVNAAAGVNYNLANFGGIGVSLDPSQATFYTGVSSGSAIGASGGQIGIKGLFTGASGERLGIAYDILEYDSNKMTTGAAAFRTP